MPITPQTDPLRDSGRELFDDIPEANSVPKSVPPMVELGVSGLKRAGGYVDEEFLPALRGRKSVQVFREMSQNDSIVGALLFAIQQLIKGIDFKVTPADQSEEAKRAAEFLESCKDDMSHSWGDFITEALSCLPYGWAWHEIVYKKRVSPWHKNPRMRSKYTDGLIGWRKLPIRSQETLLRWVFDDNGGIQAMVQLAPPQYKTVILPINKSLLFRTSQAKGNPEGMSILRTAYRSWYLKKRLEEFEAIGVERDLAGMPVAKVPASYLSKTATSEQKAMVDAFRKMVRGVRRDENEGLILPNAYDQDSKNPLFEFELLSAASTRQFDTNSIIGRYEQRILMSVLADFILVGHEGTGSYAMHTDKQGLFRAAINSIVENIADVLNRHAVPRLFEINGWKMAELPQFEPVDVDPPDLQQLAGFISATSAAGMQWFPDPDLEKFAREIARLPAMTEEQEEFKRQQQEAEQAMGVAEAQMGVLGMKQKAEMTAQGLTPEQAEMQSQMPTPEQQETQMSMQGDPIQQKGAEVDAHKQTADVDERRAQADHKREIERRKLEDQYKDKDHKRSMTAEQFKAQVAERQAKAKERQAKKAASKPPPKKGKR